MNSRVLSKFLHYFTQGSQQTVSLCAGQGGGVGLSLQSWVSAQSQALLQKHPILLLCEFL